MGASPELLQQVRLPIVEHATCESPGWYEEGEITDNMICAGFQQGEKGSCHVSGSPDL